MVLIEALNSLGDDPIRRRLELDELLSILNEDERRRIKRLLNSDKSLVKRISNLPIELIVNVTEYLQLDDFLALVEAAGDPIVRKPWLELWFSIGVCNEIARNSLRVLAFHDGYEGFLEEIDGRMVPCEGHRRDWVLKALVKYGGRKRLLYTLDMLQFFGSIRIEDDSETSRLCNGRLARTKSSGDCIEVFCRRSGTVQVFREPDRTLPWCWQISGEYLVAFYGQGLKMIAWRLDETHAEKSCRLPSTTNSVVISGPTVATIGSNQKEVYIWSLEPNSLRLLSFSLHVYLVLFHPEDAKILFAFLLKPEVTGPILVVQKCSCHSSNTSIDDYGDSLKLSSTFTRYLAHSRSDRPLAKLTNFDGSYELFQQSQHSVTFNVYTERFELRRIALSSPWVSTNYTWEGQGLSLNMVQGLADETDPK